MQDSDIKEQQNTTTNEIIQTTDYQKHPRKILLQDPNIDRSKWFSQIMEKHPGLRDLHERLYPIERAGCFAQIFSFGSTDVKENITEDIVIQLVMQHLKCLGLHKTQEALEEESRVQYQEHYFKNSRLKTLLRVAIMQIEKIFDIVLEPKSHKDSDTVQELIEHLINLGYEDEEEENLKEDVPIWDEPPDSDQNILYMEDTDSLQDEIKAASLNKLVEALTAQKGGGIKIETFLLTYQSFTTPKILFQKLVQRYHVPKVGESTEEEYQNKRKAIQLKVVNVLMKWLENFFSHFNKSLIHDLREFIDKILAQDNLNLANRLRSILEKKEKGFDAKKTIFEPPNLPEPIIPKNIFSPKLSIFDVNEEEIARQLTLIEFQVYTKISPTELLNQAWNKAKYKHRAPNVLAFIQRFNDVSLWVATCVVRRDKPKSRANIINKFIKIAEHCRKLNNFNGLTAILAGLNSSPIFRLKKSWEIVKQSHYDTYQSLQTEMSSTQSYKAYRESLKQANPPCIPYLGIYLTDLTFIEDGSPDYLGNLINYSKRTQISKVILNIQQYQQKSYDLQYVHQIAQLLIKLKKYDETELYSRSLEVEPRVSANKPQIK
ncbi:ras guanine nucleotide exchange factor i-related [Anaeramoeba ignava]|uniref:Ras guanine nucleotide exchange factor i-related n=1 Tax=Anaeramoeba ignava TaxID=1746090 RepID=A0A9Q0LTJ2_ANAIG|nr:ras guanine nucleotide exchange factor i-related [Anaeramoeba ignava]